MDALLTFIPFLVLIAVVVLMARRQNANYKSYLEEHAAEARKATEAQERSRVAIQEQTKVLERIADALEKRS